MQNLNKALSKVDVLLPPIEYIKTILQVICDSLGYSFATVIEVDKDGKGHMITSCNLPEDYPKRVNEVTAPVLSSPSGEAIETGKIVVVDDIESEPRLKPWWDIFQEYSIKTLVWVPLFRNDQAFGTCVLYDTNNRNISDDALKTLGHIGVMASIAIKSNQYLDKLNTEIQNHVDTEEQLRQVQDELEVRVEERTEELSNANQELHLFRKVMEQSSDAIFITDPETSQFLDVNEMACLNLGYKRGDMLGKRVIDIDPLFPDLATWVQHVEEVMEKGHVMFEGIHQRKDETTFPVEINVKYIHVGPDKYLVAVVRDITERKRMEDELKASHLMLEKRVAKRTVELERINKELAKANVKLLELELMKSDFLDTVSHELRTPLTSILGYSVLLLDGAYGEMNEKQTQYVDGIWRKGMHQLQLVNDILDLSKLESGHIKVNLEPVSVSKTITDVMFDEVLLAKNMPHETAIEIADGVANVCADKVRLKQVLLNLVGNAIKFTPGKGRIVIKAENMGEMVRISVIDNGIGIKEEDMSKLFNRFVQIDPTNSRKVGGTGLGLAIVKDMMELMNGSVELESEFGKGTTFNILLPKATGKNHSSDAFKVPLV